ncbi:MAG: protein-L-isoaspartate(D-aspartate) O-methyltransferase [Gemmatimonadota bacterium]|nr:MAG: protein-L-isoaspartate(D-aspartate) O-methyltransferase [Gemmatimonadota bacterium]
MAAGRLGDTYGGYRARLLERLRAQGIQDLAVLRAFGETPRHLFVPEALRHRAYEDGALPIGHGQTISQPTTQARYLEALGLSGTERVLEIGTGSGYQAALLSHLARVVVSVERVPPLAQAALAALDEAAITGVVVVVGDGSLGWPAEAPYDAILVAAASPVVPKPLLRQLAEGGRLVLPLDVGQVPAEALRALPEPPGGGQVLVRITRQGGQYYAEPLGAALFVPLIGRHGFDQET